jgi:putative peptidoglycan lipid II flippase
VAVGGFVQFAFQLPAFFRSGYVLGFEPEFGHPGLKKMALLLIPATMALAVNQINIIVSNILASYLPDGSITYLYYAMRLIQFPIGIFGVAMGMAVLPALSEHAVKGDLDKLREDFSFSLRLLFFIAVPCMAGLIALREPIVNILFQRGQFDYTATRGTADALLFYSIGIWSIVGVRVTTATFYALQDTKTPVRIAVIGVVSNLLLSLLLMGTLKHSGLALANSLASIMNFLLLSFFLRKKLQRIDAGKIIKSFLQVIASSCIMGVIGWALLRGELWTGSGSAAIKAGYLSGSILICIIMYTVLNALMKNEELSYVREMLSIKFHKRTP